ncbi:MAG: ABC transporter ATP-binding protein [Nitrospiraceae bacterium]|nr:ABC transporter ATP-binding protein [Nitrospiraceae bacterium]OQW30935.1 MAG: iron ABC transporter ATP-binding protein [Nitrospira sp. SG-bin2]
MQPLSSLERRPDQRSADPAIAVEEVSFRYGGELPGRPWTIERVSFEVTRGEVLGIVGPNGSGKSSLLKLLAGLLRAGSGRIRVLGQVSADLSPIALARMLAVVLQEQPQVFPFTVAETVLMGRFPHRQAGWWNFGSEADTPGDLACAQRAMAETDVLSLADRPVSELSGGELQRVMIARALAQDPAILLLDEPTAFLDINHQLDICSLISRLRDERRLTVVLVSHDLNIASQYCDRVLMLKAGRLSHIGSPAETIRPDVLQTVYGCEVVVDAHPQTGKPRVTMPMSPS